MTTKTLFILASLVSEACVCFKSFISDIVSDANRGATNETNFAVDQPGKEKGT